MQNANPNEVTLQPMLWRHPIGASIKVYHFYINFKRARAVGCLKSMALNEEILLQFLDREAPFCTKVSKVGCHKKVLLVWGHTESFG